MYESPITRICGEITNKIIRKDEEHLMTIITQQVGYQVDKDELIKALNYDRDQYQKGYNDALDKIKKEIEQEYSNIKNDYHKGRNIGLWIATQIIEADKDKE